MKSLREFCIDAENQLNAVKPEDYAVLFVRLHELMYRQYVADPDPNKWKLGLVFSTLHGLDLFKNIIECLDGKRWIESGEYGDNFRKIISKHKGMN